MRTTTARRAFNYAAPAVWNTLYRTTCDCANRWLLTTISIAASYSITSTDVFCLITWLPALTIRRSHVDISSVIKRINNNNNNNNNLHKDGKTNTRTMIVWNPRAIGIREIYSFCDFFFLLTRTGRSYERIDIILRTMAHKTQFRAIS